MKIENAKQFINDYLRWNIREIADRTGLGYLNSNNKMWKDGGDNIHEIEEMGSKYLNNCLREVERGIEFVKTVYMGQMDLIETIRDMKRWDEIEIEEPEVEIELRMYVRDEVLNLLIEKKEEIEIELNSR